MSYSNEQLRAAVDAVFDKFDADNSGTLDKGEVFNLINAAMAHMNAGRQASHEEVDALVSAVDTTGDGKIDKKELYVIFEKVANNWALILYAYESHDLRYF